MKTILTTTYLSLLAMFMVLFTACDSDNASDLQLDLDTRVEAMTLNGHEATIDHTAKTITAYLPVDMDISAVKVDKITLSKGATANIAEGEVLNCTIPHSITVRNGDVYSNYTITVKHDNVEFLTFTLDGQYAGSIDNVARTITVFVPLETNVSSMLTSFTVTDGAEVTPQSGTTMDFSSPVKFTVKLRSVTAEYTVTVVRDDMSQAPKAFIGNAASIELLGNEARAACEWMIANVPNSTYVSIQDIIDGKVKLDSYTMVWCHFDFTDWPSQLWDSRDFFNSYWLHGGAILASRDGARYINDVWRISLDQQSPNEMSGGDSYRTLTSALGFTVTGHESHDIFKGLTPDSNGRILLLDSGCSNTDRVLSWNVSLQPYGNMAGWQSRTGASALAGGDNYDPNIVTIAEFTPREALTGYRSGRVITIGTPAYEWYDRNNAANPYRDNMLTLTKNVINYLCSNQ